MHMKSIFQLCGYVGSLQRAYMHVHDFYMYINKQQLCTHIYMYEYTYIGFTS